MREEKIKLEHKAILQDKLKSIGEGLSSYSFANLYLFRNIHDIRLLFDKKDIFVKGKSHDDKTFLMLTRRPSEFNKNHIKALVRDFDFIYPVPESWVDYFKDNHFNIDFNEDDSDYIYKVEDMVSYAGNKLHKKKNLLNQFRKSYSHGTFPLIEQHLKSAIEILDCWQEESGQNKNTNDYYPCLEALEKNEQLILCGMIYYVENQPAAFALGEELTGEIFDIKFAKAKKRFKGIYQYLYNDFAKILPEKYKYFNFEEDLGTEALRHAKSSYKPLKKLKKYRVNLK